MMRDIQGKAPYPYGDALCVPLEEVVEFRQTSGSTGRPVYQPDTWQDWEWWAECWAYILWAQGYRPGDRVFIPFGDNVFVAFWAGHYAAEKIGCEVVPGGVLDTQARMLKIKELRATAVMDTPTYILGMAETAKRKMDIDPATLGISKITCAGEPGASIASTKRRMESTWNAKDVIMWGHAPCPCGRSFRLLKGGVLGRTDDIKKVKGVLLSPAAMEEVVRSIDGLGDEYEVIVDRLGDIDRIKLKVEIAPGCEDMAKRLESILKDRLRLKTNLGYRIEFYDHGKLPRYEVKAKRFKDMRKDSLHSR